MAYKIAESCMLFDFGLEIAECASWVQAWGSIFAILAAGAIARYQIKAAHRAEQKRAGARIQAVIAIADAFSELLASTAAAFDRPPEMLSDGRASRLAVRWNEGAYQKYGGNARGLSPARFAQRGSCPTAARLSKSRSHFARGS